MEEVRGIFNKSISVLLHLRSWLRGTLLRCGIILEKGAQDVIGTVVGVDVGTKFLFTSVVIFILGVLVRDKISGILLLGLGSKGISVVGVGVVEGVGIQLHVSLVVGTAKLIVLFLVRDEG